MKQRTTIQRRTVLELLAGTSVAALAGCLDTGSGEAGPEGTLSKVNVEGTSLVVEIGTGTAIDGINVIQPGGELFDKRDVEQGVTNITFELGTSYPPGEFRVLALDGEETVAKTAIEIRPELEITGIGLYRNRPEKDWDAVYGESSTDREKNGEAFVTVENTGTGPEAVIKLRFLGDVPNLAEHYDGSGIYESDQVLVEQGSSADLYSETFPFGSHISEEGMGCAINGIQGKFTVIVETGVTGEDLSQTFDVTYSGSESMHDCDISISEV